VKIVDVASGWKSAEKPLERDGEIEGAIKKGRAVCVCECVCKCSATPFCLERKKEATILFIGVQLFKLPISGRHTFTVFSLLNYEQKGQLTGSICQKNLGRRRLAYTPPSAPSYLSDLIKEKVKK